MALVKQIYSCDFCKAEVSQVWTHYFDSGSTWGRSHENNNHKFELCNSCEKASSRRSWVAEQLMYLMGIKKRESGL